MLSVAHIFSFIELPSLILLSSLIFGKGQWNIEAPLIAFRLLGSSEKSLFPILSPQISLFYHFQNQYLSELSPKALHIFFIVIFLRSLKSFLLFHSSSLSFNPFSLSIPSPIHIFVFPTKVYFPFLWFQYLLWYFSTQ